MGPCEMNAMQQDGDIPSRVLYFSYWVAVMYPISMPSSEAQYVGLPLYLPFGISPFSNVTHTNVSTPYIPSSS